MATTNKVMTYENLEHRVYEALAHHNLESLKAHLATQHPANIAAVLDRLNHAQTVSTLIRGLALGQIHMRDIWRVIQRELVSGLLMGSLLGLVAFGRALLWGSSMQLSLVVGLTIVAICTWANTIGALIPLLAYRLSIDPAVVSAPLITTLVDATGLAIYMLIAKAILGL